MDRRKRHQMVDVRPDDAVDADVEDLLGDPRVQLGAVRRDPNERRHGRRERPAVDDLAPVQHVLQAGAEQLDVIRAVLHLEDHAVVRCVADLLGVLDAGARERQERRLALLQGLDRAIQTRNLGHGPLSSRRWEIQIDGRSLLLHQIEANGSTVNSSVIPSVARDLCTEHDVATRLAGEQPCRSA